MKYCCVLLFCLLCSSFVFAQDAGFEIRFNALIERIKAEDWPAANTQCADLLKYAERIDSMKSEQMALRYMYIYSTAGLLNENKLTKDEALAKVKFLQGKDMIMASHPFHTQCYVNCTHLDDSDKNTFFTGVNNIAGTQIFSFEYVTIKDGIKQTKEQLEGKYIDLKGKLNYIAVEGNMLPRFKMRFVDGEYIVEEP